MEQEAIGPYLTLSPLGEGGMGTVYRAVHQETGRLVALKTVKLLHESALQGIRREIQALSRLSHPGIVKVLEEGLHQGLPWYAMELLEGVTLQQWARSSSQPNTRADLESEETSLLPHSGTLYDPKETLSQSLLEPTLPNPLQTERATRREARQRALLSSEELRSILTMVCRICEPLSYLHGEGLIHQDLKPGNIIVRPDGTIVLVDFGLTASFSSKSSRETLVLGTGGGTVYYMAPEQIQGETADARVDLYALGCILYELLSGNPPFMGSTSQEILFAHLLQPPAPLSASIVGVPPALDELLAKLLAKDPRQRLGYADTLAAWLVRLGAKESKSPPVKPYLYRPGLAGRAETIAALRQALPRWKAKKGGLIWLGGESGIGKTRLAVELAQSAKKQQIQVLVGKCLERAPSPLEGLRAPLRSIVDHCQASAPEEAERLFGSKAKILAAYEPSLAELKHLQRHPAPLVLPAKEAQQRLFGALTETFLSLSSRSAVLLILDDLQWADDLLLGWLSSLRPEVLEETPLTILGTYRPEEASEALQELLGRSAETSQAPLRLLLGRLDLAAVQGMVSDMLSLSSPAASLGDFLLQHSEGNPLFVSEYLRAAVSEGILVRDEWGSWQIKGLREGAALTEYQELPLPRSLLALIERRLDALPPEALSLARAAAVLGRESYASLLVGLSALGELGFFHALEELRRREIIESAESGALRFVHDKLREVCYARIPLTERASLHQRAARCLEDYLLPEERPPLLSALAWHWEEARELQRARAYYLEAAHYAQGRYAYQDAEQLYRSYFRLSEGPSEESIDAHNELGEAIYQMQGKMEEARREHQRALKEAEEIANKSAQAKSLRALGLLQWKAGYMEQARLLFAPALLLAREAHDRKTAGLLLNNLGIIYQDKGELREAQTAFEQALLLHREVNNRQFEILTLNNLGSVHLEQGNFPEVEAIAEEALALIRQTGLRHMEGGAMAALATLHLSQGRVELAKQLLEGALEVVREVGYRRYEAITLGRLAALALLCNEDLEATQRYYTLSEALLFELGDRLELCKLLCIKGHLSLAQAQSASASIKKAQRLVYELGATPQSAIVKQLSLLQRAQAAFDANEQHRLFRGHLIEDIPAPIRTWLRETQQL